MTAERSAEELLQEFERTGRPEPFEEIVRRYSGMVYHVCQRICRDRHDAEDATQAVFAALAVGRKKENGEIRTVGPWLRQVARRVSLDIRRGKSRRQRRETLCATDGTAADPKFSPSRNGLDAEEVNQLVKEELDKLPVKYRLPLVLHYFGGMEQEEMAKELGCRPGTLRVRLHRGRLMLAKRLAKRGVTLGVVAMAVALTRVIHAAVADSLIYHGHAHATAGRVIHATTSGPMAVAHGVAASKLKIACAVVLIGACVVRAGAEVYEYIRPLQSQLRLPVPINLDQLIRPFSDPLIDLPRVDAKPAKTDPPTEIQLVQPLGDVKASPLVRGPVPILPEPQRTGVTTSLPPMAPLATAAVSRSGYLPARVTAAYPTNSNWKSPAGNSTAAGLPPTIEAAASGSRPGTSRTPSYSGKPGGKANHTPTSPPPTPAPPTASPPSTPVDSTPSPDPVLAQNPGGTQNNSGAVALTSGIPAPATSSESTRKALKLQPVTQTLAEVQAAVSPPSSSTPSSSLNYITTNDASVRSAINMADLTTIAVNLQSSGFVPAVTFNQTTTSSLRLNPVSGNIVQQPSPVTADQDTLYVDLPANPQDYWTYRQGNAVAQLRWNNSKLSGNGVMPRSMVLDTSGQIIATGTSGEPVLDLSMAGPVRNEVDNLPDRRNGWYVDPHAKIILPMVHVETGTHAYTWGDSPDDTTPDLVNSARLTLHDVVAAGDVSLAFLSISRSDVPALPGGVKFIGLWEFDDAANVHGGVDLAVRYDAAAAITAGISESDLRLWRYANGWTEVPFTQDLADHVLFGQADSLSYFAVGAPVTVSLNVPVDTLYDGPAYFGLVTPEPSSVAVVGGLALLLAGRRRRRR